MFKNKMKFKYDIFEKQVTLSQCYPWHPFSSLQCLLQQKMCSKNRYVNISICQEYLVFYISLCFQKFI